MLDRPASPTLLDVEAAITRLYLGAGLRLRDEDRKKAREVTALLDELARAGLRDDKLVVEVAAGHAYLALLGAELLGLRHLWLIERDPDRISRLRQLAAPAKLTIEIRQAEAASPSAWPEAPHAVVALHACGRATDDALDGAVAAQARFVFLVPCCYGRSVPSLPAAEAAAERLGIPPQSELRRRFLQSYIDSDRVLRLEAAGYEVTAVPLVPPTVTPHNLLLRARRVGEPSRMQQATARLARLREG